MVPRVQGRDRPDARPPGLRGLRAAGASRARGSGDAAIHRRHDRRRQGRDAHPPQPAWPTRCSAGPGTSWQPRSAADHALRRAVLPRLRPDGRHEHELSINGATMVLLPRFTVKETLKAIEKYQPDLFPGVPTMYLALARAVEKQQIRSQLDQGLHQRLGAAAARGADSASRRSTGGASGRGLRADRGLAGDPLQSGLRRAAHRHHRPATAQTPTPRSWTPRRGTFLPPGEQGEMVVRGPQVMQGYWKRPDETAKVLRDGWLRTGDIARDERGRLLHHRGPRQGHDHRRRATRSIRARSRRCCTSIRRCWRRRSSACQTSYRGETVQRLHRAQARRAPATAEELTAFCRERLAPYKVPEAVRVPRVAAQDVIGKVLRRELRDEAIAGAQRQRA